MRFIPKEARAWRPWGKWKLDEKGNAYIALSDDAPQEARDNLAMYNEIMKEASERYNEHGIL